MRLGIGVGIVAWLIARMNVAELLEALRRGAANWPWLVTGCALLLVALLACGLRWQLVLKAQRLQIPGREVFRIFFVGQFFNLFMIGATGGDLVKAFLAARTAGSRKTEAVSSVLIDRIIGLTALAFLAGVMVLLRAGTFFDDPSLRPIGIFILAFAGLMLLAVVAPFSRYGTKNPRFAGRDMLPAPGRRLAAILRRAYEAWIVCRRNPALLCQTFALSLVNHLLAVAACIAFGRALRLHLGIIDYLTYIPVIGVFGAIPLTPGGLGLREGAAVILLAPAGVARPEAVLLSLLLYAGLTVWSLFGGLWFVRSTSRGRREREK